MKHVAVVLVSLLAVDMDKEAAEAALHSLVRPDPSFQVTGVALFDGQRILAYWEGLEAEVDEAVARTTAHPAFDEHVFLARGRIGQRRYRDWLLPLKTVGGADLSRVIHADWRTFSQRMRGADAPVTGMEHLAALMLHPPAMP